MKSTAALVFLLLESAEKRFCSLVFRIDDNLFGCTLLRNNALIHKDDIIGNMDSREVVLLAKEASGG